MSVTELRLKDFSVFQEAEFAFSPGLNVLIGANATGKSYVTKVAYACLKACEAFRPHNLQEQDGRAIAGHLLSEKLAAVFRPDGGKIDRLIRRPPVAAPEPRPASASITFKASFSRDPLEFQLAVNSRASVSTWPAGKPPRAIFMPSREVLSIYEGFIGTYEGREVSFDETVYDLCIALNAPPMRGKRLGEEAEALLKPLKEVLRGVSLKGDRFYLREPGQEWMEAHLSADGLRKVGTLQHLISNGALAKGAVLFWDEPESNLNPKLITVAASLLMRLAGAGVQTFIATHDYLLTSQLSLAAEYQTAEGKAAKMRFFCLGRDESKGPVHVTSAATLAAIPADPILQEFEALYDRERDLFYGSGASAGGAK